MGKRKSDVSGDSKPTLTGAWAGRGAGKRELMAAELAEGLPSDAEAILAAAAGIIEELNTAILAGDGEAAERAGTRYEACIWRLNGGTFFGSDSDEHAAARVIANHCRAVPGAVPLWGQRGEFLLVVNGIRARVVCETGFGMFHTHLAFHVVDLDRPFISPTGYKSHYDTARGGMTVDEVARGVFKAYLAQQKKPVMIEANDRERLANEPLPEWLAGVMPAPCRDSGTVPEGYVLVDVVLPAQRAFVVKKWAEAARGRLVELRKSAQEAAARMAEERQQASRARVEDARKRQGEVTGRIRVPGRYRVARVHHPVFEKDVGKIIVAVRYASSEQVWGHDDKPITYRNNRAGRRVVDFDPSCVQSLYHIDDLEPVEGGQDSKIE
ncbi:klcB [Burkholderia cenocepacia]|uniref:klcB n=1 Tax=Burkholderia cenocepacia TaxID=95486 RepID=UPI002ABDF2D0|nr:klcB [Burkholderia cenocepacia]